MVVGPAPDGAAPDVEYYQTYASGPRSEVADRAQPEFDNNITVHGPEVKALVQRYLTQMIHELGACPVLRRRLAAEGRGSVAPHQVTRSRSFTTPRPPVFSLSSHFNTERVGLPSVRILAITTPSRGVIDRLMRIRPGLRRRRSRRLRGAAAIRHRRGARTQPRRSGRAR
jgi:hypothetical protein